MSRAQLAALEHDHELAPILDEVPGTLDSDFAHDERV